MIDEAAIRVMIVDDHTMVRKGLAAMLKAKPDLNLVGAASNGQEALQLCEKARPDVILMDLVMPRMDGTTAIRAVREQWPDVKVIALTSFKEKDLVQRALEAGAISYLLKNVSIDDLAQAIRAACEGHSTLAPEATQALIQAASQGPRPGHDLTPREREVLELMVEGLTNPEIAQRLIVSLSTARAHVSSILSKLGVSNRAEAVASAFRLKLVT
ncbi:MAG: response regulator transcription factor [Anaerolineae bacterium]|jgi:NarL family two-component system response regulator LiaR